MENDKIVNVIRHLAFEDLGSFANVFENRGYQIRYHEAGIFDMSRLKPDDPSLLVILGGPISVNDGAIFPFIQDELDLLSQRIHADLPTLGICLGAQFIAKAAGASVYPGNIKEIGWGPLKLTDAGKESAVRYLSEKHCSMLHWHGETFELPQEAVLLASSENYTNQAFRMGKRILGLQFHPEITRSGMEQWLIGHIGEIMQTEDISVEQLRQDTQQYANQLEIQGELFIDSWMNEVLD